MMKKIILILAFIPILLFSKSINFTDALKKTLQNNKSLKAKKLSIKNSKLNLKKAKGYNYGQLYLDKSAAITNNALNIFGMKLMSREATFSDFGFSEFDNTNPNILNVIPEDLNNPERRINISTKFIYDIPIFTGFQLTNAKKMALLQIKANIAKYKFDEKQLGLNVLKAYNGAVAAKYFIKATKKAKKATKSFVYFASEMFKEGIITNIEVKQAKVYDMEINSKILEAKNKYILAIAYLKFLTDDASISDVKDFANIHIEKNSLNKFQKRANKNRDDLEWMRQNEKTLEKKISFEKGQRYPTIGVHLEYGFNDNKLNINNKKDYYTGAIGINYKIFNGFKTSVDIQKAKIEYAKMKYNVGYMKNAIKLQVEKAFLTLQTKKSILIQKIKAKKLADKVLIQAEEMYKNQLMKMSDLLMQQASSQKARADVIMAKYNVTITAAELKLALGDKLK